MEVSIVKRKNIQNLTFSTSKYWHFQILEYIWGHSFPQMWWHYYEYNHDSKGGERKDKQSYTKTGIEVEIVWTLHVKEVSLSAASWC